MKKICIITDTLKNDTILFPLMQRLREDDAVTLTVLSTGRHKTDDIALNFVSLKDGDLPAEESLEISLIPGAAPTQAAPDREQHAYAAALKEIVPEILVLFGSSMTTFSAAVAAFLNNIPVAHIQGGESDYGVWDDAYGFGITKIANLHFTATETYRRRVIGFGEHPDRVFNVGSLAVQDLLARKIPDKEVVCQSLGMNPADEFIFVSMTPDRSIGSRNSALMQSVSDALENPKYNAFKLVCEDPGPRGFGRIMKRGLDRLSSRYPGRVCFLSDETLFPGVMAHCRAIVGNTDHCVVEGATLRTPAVIVGDRLKDRENPGHMVPAGMDPAAVSTALDRALCPTFKLGLLFLTSPFEKEDTPGRIKEVLRAYTLCDTRAKTHFNR